MKQDVSRSVRPFPSSNLNIKNKKHFLEAFKIAATKTLSELGDDVKVAILYHAGKIQGVQPQEALDDPIRFAVALEEIFSEGSSLLEDKMIELMCNNLGIPQINIGGAFDQKIAAVYVQAFARKANIGEYLGKEQEELEASNSAQKIRYRPH